MPAYKVWPAYKFRTRFPENTKWHGRTGKVSRGSLAVGLRGKVLPPLTLPRGAPDWRLLRGTVPSVK